MTKKKLDYFIFGGIGVVVLLAALSQVPALDFSWLVTLLQGAMGVAVIGVVGAMYFIPALVARNRHHRQRQAILVLNLFAGWTAIGWIVALVWANTADVEPVALAGADADFGMPI
jgi:hypothetical protein